MAMMRSFVLLAVVLLCSSASLTEASITIVDSGKEYSSKTDKLYGPQLARGAEYPAHLQQIIGNAHLCQDSTKWKNWNVTVPDDGLPVALLVKRGNCDDLAKARYASQFIQPPGVVKFLIIDGEEHIKEDEDYMLTAPRYPPPTSSFESLSSPSSTTTTTTSNGNSLKDTSTSILYATNDKTDPSSRSLRRKKKKDHKKDDPPITVSLLHVTYGTGYDLLELIMREMDEVKKEGGTKITLNATDSPTTSSAVVFLWVCLVFLISVMACCFLINSIGSLMMEAQEPPQQVARPRRRRLTREQVRANIPIGVFDGTRLVYAQHENNVVNDNNKGGDGGGDDENNLILPTPPSPEPHSLDGCTICLDEYAVGDKLRCLPCEHTFHAKCIGKWLSERVATCPLCKIDLYESEDESEEEEEEAVEPVASSPPRNNDVLAASWASAPPEAREAQSTPEQTTTTTTTRTETRSESAWFSWGRSWFSRNGVGQQLETQQATEPSPGSMDDTLATPLLQSNNDAENPPPGSNSAQPTDPPTTDQPEEPSPIATTTIV